MMARRDDDLIIYDTVTGQRTVIAPSPTGAFVNRRHVAMLPPELYHVATAFSRTLYCVAGDPFDPTDLVNFLEPDVYARVTGTFLVDHYSTRELTYAMLDVPKILFPGNCYVKVIHDGVDEHSRMCMRCGRTVGTPIVPAGKELQ